MRTVNRNGHILTLVLKKIYPDKKFNLYTVCEVKNSLTKPLYDETFDERQYHQFFIERARHWCEGYLDSDAPSY